MGADDPGLRRPRRRLARKAQDGPGRLIPAKTPRPAGRVPSADAGPLVLAGLEAHRAGRLDEADALYARALKADPDHVDALNLAGALAFARGRTDLAIRLIGKAVGLAPGHLDAHLNLAEAQETAGRLAEAVETCRKAIRTAPDFAEGHARLAWLHAVMDEASLALAHARVAGALGLNSVELHRARGRALVSQLRYSEADAAFNAALALDPDDVRALIGRAAFLDKTDFTAEAAALYRRALNLDPGEPGILRALGGVLERDGDIAGALELYDEALAAAPGSASFRYSRACCLRDLGDFDEAEAEYRRILAHTPDHAPSLQALARMRRLEGTQDRRRQLARIFKGLTLPVRQRVEAGFALGEILDRAGEFDAAFKSYTDANELYRTFRAARGEVFDRSELRGLADLVDTRLAGEYARDATDWGVQSELPVFVVGVPRSGTTLVEQICASHAQVEGAGELRAIQMIARFVATRNEGRDRVRDWDAAFPRAEAERHLAELERLGKGAARVIDKTPLNLMRLGLIGAMYPGARVIWCRRDPRDVVVSNHTLYFSSGNLYSTDLADCAFAVRQIERLGEIWRRESPLRILEVSYEALVADLEPQARRMIEFLGLPWDGACLDFHRTQRHVETPSSWQVRQPVNAGSVGRWRRYEKHLAPMLAELATED